MMTIGASFNAPRIVAEGIQSKYPLIGKEKTLNYAQFACPLGIQFLSCPIHLMGLDFFNNPNKTRGERVSFIRSNYFGMVAARCARIGPAFCVGGILNRKLRTSVKGAIGDL
eukprot:GHVR01077883.1.p1 GENE.GHVR01077883.1~~GHVR01077883.1.p1  ORF type:complete len:112 (+),score=16.13 GHVR01077883.1:92-427(+)